MLAAIEPLLESDIPRIYVTVSIDGPDGLHDLVRNRPGSARRARRTYERLRPIRRPGFKAVVGMTHGTTSRISPMVVSPTCYRTTCPRATCT